MKRFGDVLAEEIKTQLRLHGYVVKATAAALEIGRPMTEEEFQRELEQGHVR